MSTNPSKATGSVRRLSAWSALCAEALAQIQETLGKIQQGAGEMISSITGNTSTESAGAQRRAEGKTEYKQAQAQGYAEGTSCV